MKFTMALNWLAGFLFIIWIIGMIFSRFQSSPKMYPLFISFLLTGCFLQFSDYLLPNLVANFVNSLGKTVCHVNFNSHSWNGFRKTKPRGLGIRSIVESAELSRGAGWPWISCSWFANDNWRDMVVLLLLLLKNLGIRRNQARSSTYAFMLWEHKPCKKNIERTHFGGSNLVARICVRPFRCESPAVVLEVVGLEGRCWVEIT